MICHSNQPSKCGHRSALHCPLTVEGTLRKQYKNQIVSILEPQCSKCMQILRSIDTPSKELNDYCLNKTRFGVISVALTLRSLHCCAANEVNEVTK